MRKDGFDYLTLTRLIDGKRSRLKQSISDMTNLGELVPERYKMDRRTSKERVKQLKSLCESLYRSGKKLLRERKYISSSFKLRCLSFCPSINSEDHKQRMST